LSRPFIEVRGVHKHYGGRSGAVKAVDGVDLAVEPGELFGLIGHNGAGKTTLFRMMLGLLPPSAGEIRIGGECVNGGSGEGFRQVRRGIGYLPESLVLYDNLSGLETLRFFARLKGADAAECGELLERVGLAGAAAQRVRGYSKGMRQRLGFAQALLGSPRLLFLDEPTNGLDPHGIRDFYSILRELRESGVTVVLTSHILAEIQQRVDRLALMRDGRIQALGSVQALREAQDLPLSIRVVLHRDGSAGLLTRWLADLGIDQVVVSADGLVAEFQLARRLKLSLLNALTAHDGLGLLVDDLEVREPSLEDLFLGYAEAPAVEGTV
jgi:Cu-processing system ATP-binding protein